jgi:hypothetical protein
MGKKLGLDAAYKGLNLTTSVNKNSVLNKINLSGSTGMKAYDSTKSAYKFNSTRNKTT